MSAAEWQAPYVALDRFAAHFANVSDEELAVELVEAGRAVRAAPCGPNKPTTSSATIRSCAT
jgi:hypothetical protein